MLSFNDIKDAFFFVSSASYGMHSAVLSKETDQIYYRSEMGDLDEISDEDLDWEMCIDIPHKNDIGLGRQLVFEFIERHLHDEYHRVQYFFRKRGAYSRFKDLLESKGLLQSWYDFENTRDEKVLRQRCEDNDIKLTG